jgi:bifunctional non-homologous end joining protein LigD
MAARIAGVMQTRDGQWRVEAVRENRSLPNRRPYISEHYRLPRRQVVDGLVIASVQRLLAEAGVDMADLIEGPIEPAA